MAMFVFAAVLAICPAAAGAQEREGSDETSAALSDLLARVTDEALAATTLPNGSMGGLSSGEDTGGNGMKTEAEAEAEGRAELVRKRMLAVLGSAMPLFNTVHCREDLQFETVQDAIAVAEGLAYPEFIDLDKIRRTAAPCPTWPVEAADESVKRPAASDVPTLILQGAYDRRTPVYMGELAAKELTHGKLVLVPQQGHEVWTDAGSCAALIAAAFIAGPQAPLDLSCLAVRRARWSLP